MRKHTLVTVCALVLMACDGCAGTGEILTLHVKAGQPEAVEQPVSGDGLKVAIKPFEDARAEPSRLGTRMDFWGGQQEFQLADGDPGEVAAAVMRDLLRGMGWQAELVKPNEPEGDADVVLTGKIEELAVDAEGKLFRTAIEVRSTTRVEVFNRSDKSIVRQTLRGEGSEELFWFEPQDAQELLNEALTESFSKLPAETKVEDRLLRLK